MWKELEILKKEFLELGLSEAIDFALEVKGKPVMLLCDTIKGKGVDYMESDPAWHYGGLSTELVEEAKRSIGE